MRILLTVCTAALLLLGVAAPVAFEPFRMPVGARILAADPRSGGWSVSGVIDVPYVQACKQLISAATGSGWAFRHEIPLGRKNDRTLLSFVRGRDELTLLITRVATAKTTFSCGIAAREERDHGR